MTLYLKQFYESPMGLLSIVVSEEGLVELDFYDPKEEAPDPYGALEQVHPYHEKVKEWLDHYFAGDPIAISFPLAPQGTAFQERVWRLLREIPYGETKTYGQLAQDLSCGSAQAVGQAVGRNPLPPCDGKRWTTDGLCVWT